MNFKAILKNLLESGIASFNTGNYENMKPILTENVQLIGDAIHTKKVDIPAIHAKNREEVFAYWRHVNANYPNQITAVEYIKVAKTAVIKNTYGHLDFETETEIHFNEYGLVTKIVNRLL